MKKRILALTVAVLMLVSVFVAMPIFAANAALSLTVESEEVTEGTYAGKRLVTVYVQSTEALAGYYIELSNSDGATIVTEEVNDDPEVSAYTDIVLANEVNGLETYVENGVVKFIYAGYNQSDGAIQEIENINISNKTALFSFYVDVTAEEGATGVAPVNVVKNELAYAESEKYVLYATDVDVNTFDVPVPYNLTYTVTGTETAVAPGKVYPLVISLTNYDDTAPVEIDGFSITLDVDANFVINKIEEEGLSPIQDYTFAEGVDGNVNYNAETKKLVVLFDGINVEANTAATLVKGTTEIVTINLKAKEDAELATVANVVAIDAAGTKFIDTNLNEITATPTVNASADIAALSAVVTLTGKTVDGYTYDVVLADTEEGASYKAYAYDAVYGWTLVKEYGTETSFSITVENPADPFKIEILEENVNIGTTVTTPTYDKTLAQLGQISFTSVNVNNGNIGDTVSVEGTVIVPEGKTATYEVYFADSYQTVTGAIDNGQFVATSTATRAGTYAADITVTIDGEEYNVTTKRLNYAIVDTVAADKPQFNGDEIVLSSNTVGNITITNPEITNNATGTTVISRAVGEFGEGSFSTASGAMTITKPGLYEIYTDIKLADGSIADTVYKRINILRAENNVSITSVEGLEASATANTTYTVTVNAENATEYMFIRREANRYVIVQNWSTDNTWDWTPARDGIYEIQCYVRGEGAGAHEALKIVNVNVGNVSATAPEYQITNAIAGKVSTITVTNASAYAEGTEFAFEIYDDYSDKLIKSLYSTEASFDFVVNKARTYTVYVYVKEAGNSGAYDTVTTGKQAFTWAE